MLLSLFLNITMLIPQDATELFLLICFAVIVRKQSPRINITLPNATATNTKWDVQMEDESHLLPLYHYQKWIVQPFIAF